MKKSLLLYATISLFSFSTLSAMPIPAAQTPLQTPLQIAAAKAAKAAEAKEAKAPTAKAAKTKAHTPKAFTAKTTTPKAATTLPFVPTVVTNPTVTKQQAPAATTPVNYIIPLPFPPVKIAITSGDKTSENTAILTGI